MGCGSPVILEHGLTERERDVNLLVGNLDIWEVFKLYDTDRLTPHSPFLLLSPRPRPTRHTLIICNCNIQFLPRIVRRKSFLSLLIYSVGPRNVPTGLGSGQLFP
jgi:hypothetical protein